MNWDYVGNKILGICVLEIERLSSDNTIMIPRIFSVSAKTLNSLLKPHSLSMHNTKVEDRVYQLHI